MTAAITMCLATLSTMIALAHSTADWSFQTHDHVLPYSTAGSGAIGYLDGSIYILGCGDEIMEYDLEHDTVSTLNNTLSPSLCLNGQSSVQSGSKIYGISSTSGPWNGGLFVFNLETMSFEDPILNPFGSLESTSCVALSEVDGNDGTLYIIGGSSNPQSFYEVDLSTLQWRTGSTTNEHREHSACIVDRNGSLWAIAGRGAHLGAVERYHPQRGVWESMSPLYLDQLEGAAVSLSNDGDHIVVMGGYIPSIDTVFDRVIAIDIESGYFRNIDVVDKGYPVRNTAFITVNGTVYLFGGSESTDSMQSFSVGSVHPTTARPTAAPTTAAPTTSSILDDDTTNFTERRIVIGAVVVGVLVMVIVARFICRERLRAFTKRAEGREAVEAALLDDIQNGAVEGIQTV